MLDYRPMFDRDPLDSRAGELFGRDRHGPPSLLDDRGFGGRDRPFDRERFLDTGNYLFHTYVC